MTDPLPAPERQCIPLQRLPHGTDLPLPSYATEHSAGVDLPAAVDDPLVLEPGDWAAVPTGLSIALPAGMEAQVRPRSGLAFRHAVTVLNSPGTIDADYRGEIKVLLINLGKESFSVTRGLRVAQMVIARHCQAEWVESDSLETTSRGSGGFGSTGLESPAVTR